MALLEKKREADELKLKSLQLQREKIELYEKVIARVESKTPKKRNREDQDGPSVSVSHSRRSKARQITPSDSEEEGLEYIYVKLYTKT